MTNQKAYQHFYGNMTIPSLCILYHAIVVVLAYRHFYGIIMTNQKAYQHFYGNMTITSLCILYHAIVVVLACDNVLSQQFL